MDLSSVRKRLRKRDSLNAPLDAPLLPKTQERRRSWSDIFKPTRLELFLEWGSLVLALILMYLVYFHPLEFHYHVAKGYAHLGYDTAQHHVGLKHFHGHGTKEDRREAMKWFKLAADQGHHEAALHRGIGNIEGYTHPDDIETGETEKYLQHASDNGHHQAKQALFHHCRNGKCP